jgi:hypothetical protein
MTTQPSTRGAGAAMFALPGVSDGMDRGRAVDQMLHRASSLGFEAWWRRAANAGFCAAPSSWSAPIGSGANTACGCAVTIGARRCVRRVQTCRRATPGSLCTSGCTVDITTCRAASPSTRRCSSRIMSAAQRTIEHRHTVRDNLRAHDPPAHRDQTT